jgi:hypothetical protein
MTSATNAEQAQGLIDRLAALEIEKEAIRHRLSQLDYDMGHPSPAQITQAARAKKSIRHGCIEP